MELPADLCSNVRLTNETEGSDGDPIPDKYTLSHVHTDVWMHFAYYPEHSISEYRLQWLSRLSLKELSEILFDVGSQYTDEQPEVYGGSVFSITVNDKRHETSDDIQLVRLDYQDHSLVAEQLFGDSSERIVCFQAIDCPVFLYGALDLLRLSAPELPNPGEVLQDIELARLDVLAQYRTSELAQS